MDETRELHSDGVSVENMGAMVKRDRNHASVVIWSYCNEGGCGAAGASNFSDVTKRYDTTRPTLGNRFGTGSSGMDLYTDVEGFSHKSGETFDAFNAANPKRPKFASECCSCSSSRTAQTTGDLQGIGAPQDPEAPGLSCTAEQSNASNSRPFMSGTMVWTLFDCESVPLVTCSLLAP
jgi:beta-galactosidase/beta-glucuronidase